MFAKSKVSQSMVDAVNQVVETAPIKEPTPTGTRVYGGSYGNSAKAKQDQTKSAVDTLKGPKDKEMKEELKGDQHKIDANHNDKIDAQDFKILKGKKKVKEDMDFAKKLLEVAKTSPAKNTDVADKSWLKDAGKKPTVKSDLKNLGRFLTGKKETNEEVVLKEGVTVKKEFDDKDQSEHGVYHGKKKIGYVVHDKKSDTHTAYHGPQGGDDYGHVDDFKKHHHAISQIKASAGLNEEVELTEEQPEELVKEYSMDDVRRDAEAHLKKSMNKQSNDRINALKNNDTKKPKSFMQKVGDKQIGMIKGAIRGLRGEETVIDDTNVNEENNNPDNAPITTDTLAGRLPGGKINSFKSYKLRVRPLDKEGRESKPGDATPEIIQPQETAARKSHQVHEASTSIEEGQMKRIATDKEEDSREGSWRVETPWKKSTGTVTDKSGAQHTPMSRARDLARQAFKKVQDKTKIKAN